MGPGSRWEVYTHGGRYPSGRDAVEWAKQAADLGAGEILLTSMDADGHQTGYDLELTRAVAENVSIPVIASGGAGKPEHLYEAIVQGKAEKRPGRAISASERPLWRIDAARITKSWTAPPSTTPMRNQRRPGK